MKHLFRALSILIVGLLACGFFHLKPRKAYITHYGLCEFDYSETYKDPNAITGESATVGGVRWLKKTTKVPAQQGVSFGIEYVINSDSDERLELEEVIVFPPTGLTNPETGKNQKEDVFPTEIFPGEAVFTCYTFDYPWEIVKGTWTFQVRSGDQLLLEKSFLIE